ncbi:LPS translocon maturation chaperone LptM [Microbulbifer aggregans]|uniref:LPS translocon maturation chaperone LptM n=1 Tax=Microbulbifer aggregans TaxID=1769779 RepID=UPI001CFEE73E|nr:lipoprotein [Microbulbifer aggregans]
MKALLIPLVLLLGACGQKGPLYLPQDPAQPASAAPAPATAPTGSSESEKTGEKADEKDNSQQHTEAEAVSK